jgi:sensor histidine kinase regulating citrate/malate metabolism
MSLSKFINDAIDNNSDLFNASLATVLGTGIGLLGCVALNKVLNKQVLATCNTNLNQIVTLRTAIGDSYGCVSRMVLQGPPAPLKP